MAPSVPSIQKKWIINGTTKGLDELQFVQGPVPQVDEYGVLVRLHAAALNFRDLMIVRVCPHLIKKATFDLVAPRPRLKPLTV